MPYLPRVQPAMDHPAEWLAALRIVVGLYFAKAIWTKLTVVFLGGVVPVPAASPRWIETLPQIVARQAAENPFPFYKAFLEQTVIPHAETFAHLTALAEAGIGLLLTLGLLVGLGALVGLILVTFYGLATQHLTPAQQGFHLVLFACMFVFFFARAGKRWGLDARLARRNSRSLLSRRPFS